MRVVALLLVIASAAGICTASSLQPRLANPGFEEVSPGWDAPGWGWYSRAQAGFRSDTSDPHSGQRCLVFTNESPLEPEVYARLHQGVPVLPGVEYELSVWVRGEDVSNGQHFTDWSSYHLNLPEGTFDWKQVSVRFRTKNDQNFLSLGINVVNRCKVLAIDDISLRAIGMPLRGAGVEGEFLTPGRVIGDNMPSTINISVTSSLPSSRLEALVCVGAGEGDLFRESVALNPGENEFTWEWNSGNTPSRKLVVTVRVVDAEGKIVASASQEVEKLGSSITADIDRAESLLREFDSLWAKCQARGIPVDYPLVSRRTVSQFIPLTREDLRHGEINRANNAARDMVALLEKAIGEMRAYLADPSIAPDCKRYQTSKLRISGLSFIGKRKGSKGNTDQGPVFFCGYGHFGQVREDMAKWPQYGVNIIQIEIGPSATFPTENEVSLKAAHDIVKVLDDAARHNVKVNILLSPHYFPHWAYEKWPYLAKGGGGFLGYCVDAPEAKQVIERFLRTVVPMFKDKPALHSFCLSNEPVFDRTTGCDNTKDLWLEFLRRTHGSVTQMNHAWGTNYPDFSDVPFPGNYADPQFYDYCIFNQERFAGWHKWMADIIHELAPDIPVHAKVMNMFLFARHAVVWGVDQEKFGAVCEINGNDCQIWPGPAGEWAINWHGQNLTYDLQRSLNKKPIFNSENHLVMDRFAGYVPGEHFRTAIWQGAIHGQGATTIWVWERAFDHASDFYGSVMERPACADAVGRTCLDLNRFAEEVTALQNKPSPVAIVYSMASLIRNERYPDAVGRTYTALSFSGVKIDFISERQLAQGKGRQYKMIVLPEVTHLPPAAFNALVLLPATTQIVIVGDAPARDPYGKRLMTDLVAKRATFISRELDTREGLRPALHAILGRLGALPSVKAVDVKTGRPIWGVEWLPAQLGNRMVVNLVNLTTSPVEVKILATDGSKSGAHARMLRAIDLLSLGGRDQVRVLKPMTPVLAEIRF